MSITRYAPVLFVLGAIILHTEFITAQDYQEYKVDELSEDGAKRFVEGEARQSLKRKIKRDILFPNWAAPDFDWGLDPIVGLVYQSTDDGENEKSSVNTEFGLEASVRNIPLSRTPAGLFVSVAGGRAYGSEVGTLNSNPYAAGYKREYASLPVVAQYRFYRLGLTPRIGYKAFGGDLSSSPSIRSSGINVDNGILILPLFSAHYTFDMVEAYYSSDESSPFLVQKDHWLHARFFTNVMKFYIDAGPGFTIVDQRIADGYVTGQTDYIKAVSSLSLLGSLGLNAYFKYVMNASAEGLGDATTGLPSKGLYDASIISLPEDSMVASAFFGIKNIIGGFGLGWQYYYEVLNFSEKDGKKREVEENNGFMLSYQVKI